MAVFPLLHHTSYEDAKKIAAQYPGAFVGIRQHQWLGHREVQPIVKRVKIKAFWYNYYEDNTYNKTVVAKRGKPCFGYAPYLPCPSPVLYEDFLAFCYNDLLPLKGKFATYLHYLTDTGETVAYSVKDGQMLCDIGVPLGANPLLFFEYGGPKHNPRVTGDYGGRGSRSKNKPKKGETKREAAARYAASIIDDGD